MERRKQKNKINKQIEFKGKLNRFISKNQVQKKKK